MMDVARIYYRAVSHKKDTNVVVNDYNMIASRWYTMRTRMQCECKKCNSWPLLLVEGYILTRSMRFRLARNLCCFICRWSTDFAVHDDVIKWKHISALLALYAGNSPANSPHKGQWRGALMFSLICAWINGWVNHRDAGDLRRHRADYDVTVMLKCPYSFV